MMLYRITLAKWAGQLTASGRAARWNSNGHFMIYAASTRALACLENMVHRRGMGSDELFQTTVIQIPDGLKIKEIGKKKLPADWQEFTSYAFCQAMGDAWLKGNSTPLLRVPSAIIPEEFNYLINPRHPDFGRIKVQSIESFAFDERLL